MAEEHVLLINEAEEKPEEQIDRQHSKPKGKHKLRSTAGRWIFGRKSNRLSPSRRPKVVITRSKSASTFVGRCRELAQDFCPDFCGLSFNFYCKLVAALIVILFLAILFTHRQDYSSPAPKYSPPPSPSIAAVSSNKSYNNHSISYNNTSFHQIYYNTKYNHSLPVINTSLPACPSVPQHLGKL